MRRLKMLAAVPAALALAGGVAACGDDEESAASTGGGEDLSSLSGQIEIDGSSTVAPISEPVGTLFSEATGGGVDVTVGTAGTGGGFERFCRGETDVSDASRPIDPAEQKLCEENGVEYEEIVVANDALSVVVNPDNPVTCVSPDQLSEIYGEDSRVTSWSDVEGLDAQYDETLEIFSPGSDSGTFDYFTEAVNGEEGVQRTEGVNVVGENDNATVTGVSGSPGGIGYFGYSFFSENEDQLKALEIENEDGECVAPSEETAQDGSYNPLGRQLYIYPSAEAIQRPEVEAFVQFYLDNLGEVIPQAGFIALTDQQLEESQQTVEQLLSGGGSGGSDGSGGSGSAAE